MRDSANDFDDLTPTPREAHFCQHLHDHGQKLVRDTYGLADGITDSDPTGAIPFFDLPTTDASARAVHASIFADGDAAQEAARARVRASQEPLRAYVDKAGRVQIVANDRLPSRGEIVGGPRHTYELSNEQEDTPDLFATARYWQDVLDGVFRLARTLRQIVYGAGVVGFFALGVWAILKVLHKL